MKRIKSWFKRAFGPVKKEFESDEISIMRCKAYSDGTHLIYDTKTGLFNMDGSCLYKVELVGHFVDEAKFYERLLSERQAMPEEDDAQKYMKDFYLDDLLKKVELNEAKKEFVMKNGRVKGAKLRYRLTEK